MNILEFSLALIVVLILGAYGLIFVCYKCGLVDLLDDEDEKETKKKESKK